MQNTIVNTLHRRAYDRKRLNSFVREELGCGAATLRAAATDALINMLTRDRAKFTFLERANAEANIKHLQSIGDAARRSSTFNGASIADVRARVLATLDNI